MGRKWTNIKFVFDGINGRNKKVEEASSNPRTRQEAVFDFLRERWSDENVYPMKHIDLMFGNPSDDKLQRWIDEVFEEFEFIRAAGVVHVTDSANIGFGKVFERADDGTEIVDEYTGYEGARGEDVSGMIHDDHSINVSATWYWD